MNDQITAPEKPVYREQPYTMQEAFDTMCVRLLEQGQRGSDSRGGCRFTVKKQDGSCFHCAVGFIMPENHAVQSETGAVTGSIVSAMQRDGVWPVSSDFVNMADSALTAHDNLFPLRPREEYADSLTW